MRPRERALIERLREIVEFVEGLEKGVAVIENGDCTGFDDAKRIRAMTGMFDFSCKQNWGSYSSNLKERILL